MRKIGTAAPWAAWAVVASALAGCGGGGITTVGGTVSGLAAGTAVTLQLDGGNALVLGSNGAYRFDRSLAAGDRYDVQIAAQPARATCTVANGSGRIDSNASRVDNIDVVCVQRHSIGGVVAGLAAGTSVTLQNNGADALVVGANGAFSFPTTLLEGTTFAVTVSQQPADRTCTVASGSGEVPSTDVANVSVTCS